MSLSIGIGIGDDGVLKNLMSHTLRYILLSMNMYVICIPD